MSVRHIDENETTTAAIQQLRSDIASVRSADGELTFENLTETEKSAATIGVAADAWKPISWLNQGHYGELLRNNALSGPLTQKIEAFKTVSSR